MTELSNLGGQNYSRHYRIINIVLALTLLECIWSMLCT